MNDEMMKALVEYGRTIRERGWKEGEPLIDAGEKKFQDFRRWATALGIMLRTGEILKETEL
jgi:hypothetical protein